MGRSRFPGKPFKFQTRRRISVLSGTVYCEDAGDDSAESETADRFEDDRQTVGDEKECISQENKSSQNSSLDSTLQTDNSNQKAMVYTTDKTKSAKKTVTFGTVESCEDIYTPLKKLPSKNQPPLASIIKKKSALKPESGYHSILKPAKLTDLSSKLSFDSDGFRSSQTSKPFSCLTGGRSSPPPFDKPAFARSLHSSRIIKPNRKFVDEEDLRPLKKLTFNDENSSSRSSSPNDETEGQLPDSDESWDSTSTDSITEEEQEEEDEKPQSQLLSGKVIIREARLQLGNATSHPSEGPFSTFSSSSSASMSPPTPAILVPTTTTITCGVCGAVRFYKFVKQARKFGIYTCESCRKFISKILKKEKIIPNTVLQCLRGEGKCHVPPVVRSQHWKMAKSANKARCPACWLKLCLKAFEIPPNVRNSLDLMLPIYMRSNKATATPVAIQPNPLRNSSKSFDNAPQMNNKKNSTSNTRKLKDLNRDDSAENDNKVQEKQKSKETVDKKLENKKHDPFHYISSRKRRLTQIKARKKEKVENEIPEDTMRQKTEIKGPRVKHVCRSASIVLGQPIATFPETEEKEVGKVEESSSDDDMPKLQVVEPDELMEETKEESIPMIADEPIVEESKQDEEVEIKKRKVEEPKVQESGEQPVVISRKQPVKPISYVANIRELPLKPNRTNANVRGFGCIAVDYWRAYDLDEVSSVGYAIIATAPLPLNSVCFLCASGGRDQLLYCGVCCEGMHAWCTSGAGGFAARGDSARCPRCVICVACTRPAARARCRSCTRPYHASCLRTRADWPELCAACLKCKSCDSPKVRKFVGSLPFCAACFRLRQKGNYCPLCQGCYQDNDFDSKMMECGVCSRWVHAACERLSGEAYQLLSLLPSSEEYTCRVCTPTRPRWRTLLAVYLKERLRALLKALADNKHACALLKLTPHKAATVEKLPNHAAAVRRLSFREEQAKKVEESTSATVYRAYGHRVINLQEPLMQNKEICFYDVETEYANPCVQVNDNNPQMGPSDNFRHVMMNVDKYEPISDDDSVDEQDLSELKSPLESPSLLDIKKKVNADEYTSLKQFNTDMKEIITRTLSKELGFIYKKVFAEIFPWFNIDANSVKPELEIELENSTDEHFKEDDGQSPPHIDENKHSMDQTVPKIEVNNGFEANEAELFGFEPKTDTRMCILCKKIGEGDGALEGRLLYSGQNDWIHSNCALWSAEVFEEIDGSLQNVMSAISRGKMIKCAACDAKGASVGCCAKNCSGTYHYACARKSGCAFLDDKRVFCPAHCKEVPRKNLQKDDDFLLQRPIYVEIDRKKKRYGEIAKIQVLLGSMVVEQLGRIVPCVSDLEDYLIPVDYVCSRLFWSTKSPWKLVRYTIKTKLVLCEPLSGFDTGVNITLDHSGKPLVVERIMAEINAWHKSLDMGISTVKMMQKDKSPVKISVSLEELAVKQVVDYLLDCVCRQEQDEDEPQNTADLLPPELKDAIFEDLNHDLLDGISMQDIFPKLMSYEEILGSDSKLDPRREDSPDFADDILNSRSALGPREYKKHSLKNRNAQKIDSNLLCSTIKRCKMSVRTATVTSKASQPVTITEIPNSSDAEVKEIKLEIPELNMRDSGTTSHNSTEIERKLKEGENQPSENKDQYYTQVIDFYTKIQCSPISQLDGACDDYGSDTSSRPDSPIDRLTPIPQLDGASEMTINDSNKPQTSHFIYRTAADNSYTVTIAGGNVTTLQPDLVIRGPDETTVRCDRCQCTYRNKEMYDRHIPSCDMMSTSESESENPKSPQESRTLTTLQNAFPNFAQPIIINPQNNMEQPKPESVSTRRTSSNTRQITINGTIVETGSNSNENINILADQVKGTVMIDKNNQIINSPQIVVTPQLPLIPPKSSTPSQKMITPQIINTSGGLLPYNICVKPGTSIANTNEMPQFFTTPAGIQAVITSSGNQVLTIPTNQQNILQGKNVQNCQIGTSIAVPVSSLQGIQNASILQNIQPMIRPQMQGNPTIVVPALTQSKPQLILPQMNQKSPKKQPQVQPKPIMQTVRGRGRTVTKTTSTMKRQTKLEKTYQTINPSLNGNAVIQLQPNQAGQPSIIVQPVSNQNIMSAYVEALSQQQNQNMQYIATIGPQGDFKATPTQFISTQGGLMPQTFQIQQTESGSLVAVPSGGIPILLPQGNVGILPQTLQPGTILPQGSIQTQGIITQGPNGTTIIPQTIPTQNGTAIIQQGLTSGNLATNATLLSNNNLQQQGGIGNNQTLVSQPQSLQQGTILPQFCNDQVILGSGPELQMVTDSSGCMYLTAAQPVYYGLETIVQNTVMSSQQFVSTAMQGVLAQNSSFSATTTQVFQASKIEPIVEVPTGYVVVNADQNTQQKSNLALPSSADKILNRQTSKCIQSSSETKTTPTSTCQQNTQRNNVVKPGPPSSNQPIISISTSQFLPPGSSLHTSIPSSQPIISTTIAPSILKQKPHTIQIGVGQDNLPVVNIGPGLKSPTPWQNNLLKQQEARSQANLSSSMENSMPKLTISSAGIAVTPTSKPWADNYQVNNKISSNNNMQMQNNSQIKQSCPGQSHSNNVIHISSGNISQYSPSDNEFNTNKFNQNRSQTSNSSIMQDMNHTIYTTVNNNQDRSYPVMTIPMQDSKQETQSNKIQSMCQMNSKEQPHMINLGFNCDTASSNGNQMNSINLPPHSQSVQNQYCGNNQVTNSIPCYSNNNQRAGVNEPQLHLSSSQNMLSLNQVCNQQNQQIQCNQQTQNRMQFENQSHTSHNNITTQRASQDNHMHSQISNQPGQMSNRIQIDPNRLHGQQNTSHMMNRQIENNYHMQQQMTNNNNNQHRLLIEDGNIHFHQISNNNHNRMDGMQNVHQHVTGHMNNRQSLDCSNNVQMHQMNISNRQHDANQGQLLQTHQNQQNSDCSVNVHQHANNQITNRSHNVDNTIMNQQSSCANASSDAHEMSHDSLTNLAMRNNCQNLDAINVGIQSMNVVNQIPHDRSIESNLHMSTQSCSINQIQSNNTQLQLNNQNINMMQSNDMKNELSSCAGNCVNTSQFANQYESCGNSSIIHNINMNNQLNVNNTDNSNMLSNNMNVQGMNSNNQMMHNQMYMMNHMNSSSNAHPMLGCNMNNEFNSGINQMMESTSNVVNSLGQMSSNGHLNVPAQLNNHSNQISNSLMDVHNRNDHKYSNDNIGKNNTQTSTMSSIPHLSDCAKVNNNTLCSEKMTSNSSVSNQLGYMQVNPHNNNRVINIPGNRGDMPNINPMLIPSQHNIRVMNNANENINQRNSINDENMNTQRNENANVINVPIRAIPNSAPMNINVNSSNNTVNITVQNNLVDPKIVAKGSRIDYTVQNNSENNSNNMICVPLQNGTINIPTQNSILLPKAPPTHQSGIPTNVVNPTRPTNRVLPLHRDQNKTPAQPKTPTPPRLVLPSQDMPDISMKEPPLDADLNKAIEESKRMVEIENVRREKEALELSEKASNRMETGLPSLDDTFDSIARENRSESSSLTKQPSTQSTVATRSSNLLTEKSFNIIANTNTPAVSKTTLKRSNDNDKKPIYSALVRKNTLKNKENKYNSHRHTPQPKDDGPKLIYEVSSEDGFNYSSTSLSDAWSKVIEGVTNARKQINPTATYTALNMSFSATHLLGLHNKAVKYLLQQLPGANGCARYRNRHGLVPVCSQDTVETVARESPWGAVRCGPVTRPPPRDMFSWLASPYRAAAPTPAPLLHDSELSSRRSATLPLAMRFRNLKETSKLSVGVYRSHIHGRGLFCKRDIEEGEMVIEYAGEVIRAVLADRREARYERRGAGGCYMFRVDNRLVVDATLRGNAARFINHSCDPNCYSKVVDIHGHKHIVIFALRRIARGEELTYDYKFPFEEDKIPCTCGAKKCKKYLN